MRVFTPGYPIGRNSTMVILVGIILALISIEYCRADQITIEYDFSRPRINEIPLSDNPYHRVTIDKAINYGKSGQPALPVRAARILLPPGARVATVEITASEKIFLGDGYLVEPVPPPTPQSAAPHEIIPPVPDPTIYASDNPFPEQRFRQISSQKFRGYQILILALSPVEYLPASGKLYYFPRLSVTVNTTADAPDDTQHRGLPADESAVRAKIDNPEALDSYSRATRGTSSGFELLILTTAALAPSFEPLKDYHDSTGTLTEIHTLADVGSSNPDDLRDYIRERYISDGIEFVLLGGDDDLIPAKDFYCEVGPYITYDMPVDMYYACLDGTFNYDGDDRWGEPTDGEDGGDVDLLAEIYIGRAPAGDVTEAERFVNKTLQYVADTGPYLRKVLLCGEYIGNWPWVWGGDLLEGLIDSSDYESHWTIGFPSDEFDFSELYDRDWTDNYWPVSEAIDLLNAQQHILDHNGHGHVTVAAKIYLPDIPLLTNTGLFFAYSQGCLSGHFDNFDCWGEHVTVKTDYGAFAAILNPRYGFSGINHEFNRQYWDAVFNPHEYFSQLGVAHQIAKEEHLHVIINSNTRWTYYELTLFGDPAIHFNLPREDPGVAFGYPLGTADTVFPGLPTTLEVQVAGIYRGVPMPGSGQFNYILNGGPVETVPLTELSPDRYQVTLPVLSCADQLVYYLSVEENTSGTIYDPDPSTPRAVTVISDITVILADNCGSDLGWSVSGDASAGLWQRGIPMGLGDRGDPPGDFDGNYLCFLTGNSDGDSDVEGGTTYLESPTFDLSAGDARIHYARWYSNDSGNDPNNDVFVVSISNDDGASWTTVETVGPVSESSGGWYEYQFWAGDFVEPTALMKLRFAAADLGLESIIEAAVDDIRIMSYACADCNCQGMCDLNFDGTIDPLDMAILINYVYKSLDSREGLPPNCPSENGDWNCDIAVDPLDVAYYVKYVYQQQGTGPCDPCAL